MTSIVSVDWGSLTLHGVQSTGKEIGCGSYGRVFEVDYEGTLCAAKELHALLLKYAQGHELENISDNFLRECIIWSTLRHPCVVQFLGIYYPAIDQYKLPVVVMEKMWLSLKALVDKYENIPLNVKLYILDDVCRGLRYLHSRNPPIVHRDLTPNNILLTHNLEAKITDLGVAKVMQNTDPKTMTKAPGTTDFMPPECLTDKPVYGLPLDVFSYGGVILCTITQVWPQPSSWLQLEANTGKRVYLSEIQRRQHYLDIMTRGAVDLKPLVISCLDDDPSSRPPVAQVTSEIKRIKDLHTRKNSCDDGMSPRWAEMSAKQGSQATSSTTASQKEMTANNGQLQEEVSVLQTDNVELKTKCNAMKDEIKQLTSLLGKMTVNNESQKEKIDSQSSTIETTQDENKQLKTEVQQLKTEVQQLKHQLIMKETAIPSNLFSKPVNIIWETAADAPIKGRGNTAVWLNGLVYMGGGYDCEEQRPSQGSYVIYCFDPVKNLWISPINAPYCFFAMTTLKDGLITVGGQDARYKRTNQILTMEAGQLRNYTKMITPISSATAVGHQEMLIITGGWNDEGKILSQTEVFDSNSGEWYTCNNLPQPFHSGKLVVADNVVYLLGGFGEDHKPSSAVFTASLDALSKHKLKWNTHKDTPWSCSTPITLSGTHLLTIGGRRKTGYDRYTRSADIHKLSKGSQNWKVIGYVPSARASPAAVSVGDNKIIVIGGRSGDGEVANTVWIGSCEPR